MTNFTRNRVGAPIGIKLRSLLLLTGVLLLAAACGGDGANEDTPTTAPDNGGAESPDSTSSDQSDAGADDAGADDADGDAGSDADDDDADSDADDATDTTDSSNSTEGTDGSTTTAGSDGGASDEGQDQPVINGWTLDVDELPCEASDLPGSPGGEAVLPAQWAAGNADFVNFIVDGDQRPANSVREVTGPGNIQVPCDPTLNDGHEVMIIAYTGDPGDPGPSASGETFIVVTTATVDNDEGAAGPEGDWILTTMGAASSPVEVSTVRQTTLSFVEGELSGAAPCNRYRAPYELNGSQLSVGPVAATKAMCGDPDLDRQEADYLLAVDRAKRATVEDDDTLVIAYDTDGELRFRRA